MIRTIAVTLNIAQLGALLFLFAGARVPVSFLVGLGVLFLLTLMTPIFNLIWMHSLKEGQAALG